MENSHGVSLFGLPTTILCTIFSKWLTVHSVSVLDIAVTNTAARNRLFDQLYASMEFEFENNEIDDLNETGDARKFVLWLEKRHIRIRCLKLDAIRSWKNVDDDVLKIVADIPHLMSLNLNCCDRLTDIGINYLSESCTMIQTLQLSGCSGFTDTSMLTLSQGCSMLQTLHLSGCQQITDSGIRFLFQNGSIQLKEFHLALCPQLTNQSITYLSQSCPMLQLLFLSYCDGLTPDYLQTLSTCQFLLSLNICGTHVTNTGIQYLSQSCTELKYLNLKWCDKVTDDGIEYLSKGCPKLIELNLSRKFECSHCNYISNVGLQHLSKGCSILDHLDLSRCTLVTDEGLSYLSKGCLQLQHLNITDCEKITDEGLKYVQKLSLLKYFNCSLMENTPAPQNITDEGILQLSAGCNELEHLNLSGRTTITDRIFKFIWVLFKLQDLNVSGCSITEEGLENFQRGVGGIEDIENMLYGQRCVLLGNYEKMSTSFKTANHHSY
jgi:hypothetical protein